MLALAVAHRLQCVVAHVPDRGYLVVLVLAIFTSPEFLAIFVRRLRATTGALTVPFALALAYGVASIKKDSKSAEEDSWAWVSYQPARHDGHADEHSYAARRNSRRLDLSETHLSSILAPYIHELLIIAGEILWRYSAFAVFVILQMRSFHLSRRAL